jgi:hypothetical protein
MFFEQVADVESARVAEAHEELLLVPRWASVAEAIFEDCLDLAPCLFVNGNSPAFGNRAFEPAVVNELGSRSNNDYLDCLREDRLSTLVREIEFKAWILAFLSATVAKVLGRKPSPSFVAIRRQQHWLIELCLGAAIDTA